MATITFRITGSASDTFRILFDDGGGTPAFLQYDDSSGSLEFSSDGSTTQAIGTGSVSHSSPARIGAIRLWPHTTNQVLMAKYGSDPSDEDDGQEIIMGSLFGS